MAYLGGFIDKNEYEGYSGMRIEAFYNVKCKMENGKFFEIKNGEIDISELIRFVAKNKGNLELISSVFLNTLTDIIASISKEINLPVILSGGVFQNKTLMKIILSRLNRVYFNQTTPINDGGISLGQIKWGIDNLI